MPSRTTVLASVAAALIGAVSAATPSLASSPLIVDPAGDATGPLNVVQPLVVPPLPSDDSVDIISADVAVAGGILQFTTSVVDLRSEVPEPFAGRRFYMSINHGGARLVADVDAAPGDERYALTYYGSSSGSTTLAVTGTYDVAADKVTVTVPVAALNEAIDAATAGRDNLIRPGSRLHWLSAQTYYSPRADTPFGSYFLGLYNTDAASSDDDAVYEVPAG